jgi:Domain of unknown function (DUF4386)
MSVRGIDEAQRTAAKVAGLAYPLSFVIVVAVNFGIFARLLVGSPAENARNILAHETLFRIGIAGDMAYCVGVVVALTALYVILKPVSQSLALFMAFGRLIHGLTWLLATLNLFTALRLLSDSDYRALGADHLPTLAQLYLSGVDAYYVGLLFWALGATVWQLLVVQIELYPQSTSCLWRSRVGMVCRLHPRLLRLSQLPQGGEPVVV